MALEARAVRQTSGSLRVIFMGTPEIAVPTLRALVDAGHEVVAVVTQPDRPSGRGRTPQPPPVKLAAAELGIRVLQPEKLRGSERLAELRALEADAIVVAAFGQLLRPEVLKLTRLGCLNVHPSLLPALRGASPVNWAILEGLSVTGVSIMLLDEGMDTGPVLAQEQVPVDPRDDAVSLGERLGRAGAALLVPTLELWAVGGITPRPQDSALATYSRILTRDDGRIAWALPATEIDRRIRAFVPWPGTYTSWRGKQMKVLQALPSAYDTHSAPGTVLGLGTVRGTLAPGSSEDSHQALMIATGEGTLAVTRLQMEGKRPVSAGEFVRGYPSIVGVVLDSPPGSA